MRELDHLSSKSIKCSTEEFMQEEAEEFERKKEDVLDSLKLEINEMLFRNLPGTTTLTEMEAIACAMFDAIRDVWEAQ